MVSKEVLKILRARLELARAKKKKGVTLKKVLKEEYEVRHPKVTAIKKYIKERPKKIRIKKIAKAVKKWKKKKTKFRLEEIYKPKISKGEIKHFKAKRKLAGKIPKQILESHNVFFS